MKQPAIYMMASGRDGVLYVGVTSDLIKRGYEHRNGLVSGFTKKYHVKKLAYYERHETMDAAIHREKRLKKYKREQKIALIVKENPDWQDLYLQLM